MTENSNDQHRLKPVRGRPFPPNTSGNLNGRPKGALNEADLLYRYLSQTIGRGKSKTTVAAALIRQQYARAIGGNQAAAAFIFEFRDKLGFGSEVTTEERERRAIKLPSTLTPDEYDFQIAPAREKERQYCKAVLDREDPAERGVAPLIIAGDAALDEGRYDEALRLFLEQAGASKEEGVEQWEDSATYPFTQRINNNYERALARIGLLANHLLEKKLFEAASNCADQAIAEAGGLTWIGLIRAHAHMFMGKTEEAQRFYLQFRSDKRQTVTSWEMMILRDFAEFRKGDQVVPLMAQVEASLTEAGWSPNSPQARIEAAKSKMTEEEQDFVRLNPHHIETAGIYAKYRKFDEATNIYRHLIQKGRFTLGQGNTTPEVIQALELAEVRLGQLARELLFAGRFGTALECIGELSPETRGRLSVQATYAHLLLVTGRSNEAEEIYHKNHGQTLSGKSWEKAILDDLQQLRAKGHATAASWRLESLFERSADISPGSGQQDAGDKMAPLRLAPKPSTEEVKLSERSDMPSARQLFAAGDMQGALAVYRRRLKQIEPKGAMERCTPQERDDRHEAIRALADIAFRFIRDGKIEAALVLCEEGLAIIPNAHWPSLRSAHALMLLDKPDQAEPIYQRHLTGKATPERTWASVLREEFQMLREAGLDRPLMRKIEDRLSQQNLGRLIR